MLLKKTKLWRSDKHWWFLRRLLLSLECRAPIGKSKLMRTNFSASTLSQSVTDGDCLVLATSKPLRLYLKRSATIKTRDWITSTTYEQTTNRETLPFPTQPPHHAADTLVPTNYLWCWCFMSSSFPNRLQRLNFHQRRQESGKEREKAHVFIWWRRRSSSYSALIMK